MLASRLAVASRSSVGVSKALSTTASDIKRVGVVGLGLMGHGIAQTAAEKGFDVVAVESTQSALDHGMGMIDGSLRTIGKRAVKKGTMDEAAAAAATADVLGRITASTDRGALAECDIVVEAIIEDVAIKQDLYRDLGALCKEETILASNTSSLEVQMMAEPCGRADRLVGLHFFNPVQIMKLVEVVRCPGTSDASFDKAFAFGEALGKTAVSCKDTPGFIVNRLLVPYIAQALLMAERGDATPEDIDTGMMLGCGYPMGPFTLADYVGLDTMLSILKGWEKNYPGEPAFVVPASLEAKVAAGEYGRKTGQGFFKWEGNKRV
jgi:3-hydroxyacyl-CoA dehydrogenase